MEPYDEAFGQDGTVRRPYAPALAALAVHGPRLADTGIAVGGGRASRPLTVDPLPRILTAREWGPLAAGLRQRARLLEALMCAGPDAHPAMATSHYREPDLEGIAMEAPPLAVVGFDVVRRPDGGFTLLEENVLTPGHLALPAARDAARLWEHLPGPPPSVAGPLRRALRDALGDDAAILADEPPSWETRRLARFLGVPVIGLREAHGRLPRTLLYRTAEDRLRDDAGDPTRLGELLLDPLCTGRVRVLNRPGCGMVEDKRLLVDAARLVQEVLGERPLLDVAATFAGPAAHTHADARALVFKPCHGAGGREVVVGPRASPAELARVRAAVGREPARWVAQRHVPLSVHPTVTGGRLVARPVDLRAFAVRGRSGWCVLPGGVSRYPTDPAAPVVNTSAGGGIKDVWVLSDRPRPRAIARPGQRGGRT